MPTMIDMNQPAHATRPLVAEWVRSRKADVAAVLTLAALTILFFGRVLFTDQALFWGDIMMAFYPAHDLWKQSIQAGRLPLWNPYILGGFPQLADAQYASLYPSMLLNLVMPLHRALATDLALHFFLAGALTYQFLRRQDLSPGAALAGAVILAFSGFMAVRVTQLPLIRTAAWLPLLLLVVQTMDRRPRGRSVLYLGLVLAAQVLAGHQQTVLVSSLLAVTYMAWCAIRRTGSVRDRLQTLVAFAATWALAILVALVLTAVQMFPAVEFARNSDRSGGANFEFATSFSLPPEQLPMLLAPRLFGDPTRGTYWGKWLYWEMVGYVGVVPILLAILGAVASRRKGRAFWTVVALIGVALALGKDSPLYRLAYYVVPGLAYFRVPARFLLWFGFAVAVLAAYGLDSLRSSKGSHRAWRWAIGSIVMVSIGAVYWGLGGPGVESAVTWLVGPTLRASVPAASHSEATRSLQEIAMSEGRRLALLWTLGGLVVLTIRARIIGFRACVIVLLLLIGTDLFGFGMNFYPTVAASELNKPVPTEGILELEGGTYRIITTPSFVQRSWSRRMTNTFLTADRPGLFAYRTTLVPNTNVHRRIANALGYSPINDLRMARVLGVAIAVAQNRAGQSPLIDFMSARYVFTYANVGHTYRRVYNRDFYVWFNERALPRGWLVTRFDVKQTEEEVVLTLAAGWDPRRTVILSQPPQETFDVRPLGDPGRITGRSYGLTGATFDLALNGPAIFVMSDTYYPGWKAYVDGVSHSVYRANHAFRAVFLPARARRLELVFQPESVRMGGVISGAGWLALFAVLAANLVKSGTRKTWDGRAAHRPKPGMDRGDQT